MNSLTFLYVTLSTFVHNRVEQLKDRNDRGVTSVEYGGLILVIGVVLVALMDAGIGQKLGQVINKAIDNVFAKQR